MLYNYGLLHRTSLDTYASVPLAAYEVFFSDHRLFCSKSQNTPSQFHKSMAKIDLELVKRATNKRTSLKPGFAVRCNVYNST